MPSKHCDTEKPASKESIKRTSKEVSSERVWRMYTTKKRKFRSPTIWKSTIYEAKIDTKELSIDKYTELLPLKDLMRNEFYNRQQ